jgi:hypothetical protein
MAPPIPGAGVQPLGGHDQQLRLLERDWVSLLLPILASEDANVEMLESSAPSINQFIGESAKRSEVDGARTTLQGRCDGVFSEPGFSSASWHVKDGAETAR